MLETTIKMTPKPSTTTSATPTVNYISFENAKSQTTAQIQRDGDLDDINSFLQHSDQAIKRASTTTTRNALQAQDHVIAERQRREKLAQMFIQLSSLVPGLKKIDKASVLGEAANYIKQLQERVRTLEEKASVERDGEAVVAVKRCKIQSDEDASSCCDNNDNLADCNLIKYIPEIEVQISDPNVYVRIQSNNKAGFAVRMISYIEKLHMTIISSSIMPFANNSILMITIVAQMNDEFCMTANDLMTSLQFTALQHITN